MSPFGAGYHAYPTQRAPAFGVYLHIPFCPYKCPYCDFNVYVGIEDTAPAYLGAVIREAGVWKRNHALQPAGSLYAGGGTPSMVDPGLLAGAIEQLRAIFEFEPDAEVTIEANPDSVETKRLAVLREAGVNRVSIGAQSFTAKILTILGRGHTADRTRHAVKEAREAGFDNVSLDLIYGTAGESEQDWRETLEEAIALEPEHISCYALTIEEGTAFGHAVKSGRMPPPGDDDQAAKLEAALDLLHDAGYAHYEISNWARPARESRHNLVYWTQGDYVGLGAGAHSHLGGIRSWNKKHPRDYTADPEHARDGEEHLDARTRAEEWVQLGLRLVEGVDLAEAGSRLGRDPRNAAEALRDAGLVTIDGDRLRLTRRGLLLENEVALRLTD